MLNRFGFFQTFWQRIPKIRSAQDIGCPYIMTRLTMGEKRNIPSCIFSNSILTSLTPTERTHHGVHRHHAQPASLRRGRGGGLWLRPQRPARAHPLLRQSEDVGD